MIDWHSHILPRMDDGSKDEAESIGLLRMLSGQNVDSVMLTPHFYANDESVDSFLERRDSSLESLNKYLTDDLPKLYCGAEVKYYSGISRMGDLNRLAIGDSKLLLIEMPFSVWTEYTVREMEEIARSGDVRLVIAHIDRYLRFQKASTLERLIENDVLIQANADYFIKFSSRHTALDMLRNNWIHFIGSDCHNLDIRPPRLDKALKVIERKLGSEFLDEMNDYGFSLFSN